MCLLNYNRKEKKYKHLTYAERTIFLQYKFSLTIEYIFNYNIDS